MADQGGPQHGEHRPPQRPRQPRPYDYGVPSEYDDGYHGQYDIYATNAAGNDAGEPAQYPEYAPHPEHTGHIRPTGPAGPTGSGGYDQYDGPGQYGAPGPPGTAGAYGAGSPGGPQQPQPPYGSHEPPGGHPRAPYGGHGAYGGAENNGQQARPAQNPAADAPGQAGNPGPNGRPDSHGPHGPPAPAAQPAYGSYGAAPNGNAPHHGPVRQPTPPGHKYQYTEPFDYSETPPAFPAPMTEPPAPGPRGREAVGPPLDVSEETLALRTTSAPGGAGGAVGGASGLGATEGAAVDTASEQDAPRTGGRAERRRAAKRVKRRRRLSATKEIPILIVVALLIAWVLKTFLVQAFVIPSGSMEQTIKIGDRVLVDKLTPWFGSKPERGDVVVFKDPGGWLESEDAEPEEDNSPIGIKQGKELLTFIGLLPSDQEQDLIKRVVAVGGDTVECCDKQGQVTVNGTPLNEPYLHPGNKPSEMKFKVKVPEGRLFVMGDHRSNSADSRYHRKGEGQGTIPEDLVVGRAVVIAWPFDHWRQLEEPGTYASVPDTGGSGTSASGTGENRVTQLPIPAELPLVMGVVGLYRLSRRRQRSVRSERGGCSGRRAGWFGRAGRRASR